MKSPALVLVDLQHDYLNAPGLEPSAGSTVHGAAQLLQACRAARLPVLHVWTTVTRNPDNRMRHWRASNRWICVEGTEGHQPPSELRPLPGEPVFHKTHFSGFGSPKLLEALHNLGIRTLWLAGIHLHACVRATALDAYERQFDVVIVEDATTSDDPIHAAITRRYLAERGIPFVPASSLLPARPREPRPAPDQLPTAIIRGQARHNPSAPILRRARPDDHSILLAPVASASAAEVDDAAIAASESLRSQPEFDSKSLVAWIQALSARLRSDEQLATEITLETGKPISDSRAEVSATLDQLEALVARAVARDRDPASSRPYSRRRPLGVMAVLTSWNNPAYIPLGKILPAILHGNAVVWKASPFGSNVAVRLLEHLVLAGEPGQRIQLLLGDRSTGHHLLNSPGIDAATLTGSSMAGHAAAEACARRHRPLQAELGGNNAAIIWPDTDLAAAAALVAEGAFAQAGQRCTANRRVIVHADCARTFADLLVQATARLPWGSPLQSSTRIGPLVQAGEVDRIQALLHRARASGCTSVTPHHPDLPAPDWTRTGSYLAPHLIFDAGPHHEIVQEESFGPVLVIQTAASWESAIDLVNAVRQGLAASLFSSDPALQSRFLAEARAGILKLNRSTAGATVDIPFGGWKASGSGPAEHGESDTEFHSRVQAVYPPPSA